MSGILKHSVPDEFTKHYLFLFKSQHYFPNSLTTGNIVFQVAFHTDPPVKC